MNNAASPRILLIGPYDPHCGEYTFLAPPLGVWRLAGVLESAGVAAKVFDPNCCQGAPQKALEQELSSLLISRSTYQAVSQFIIAHPLPPVRVKGKATPVPLYAVEGMVDDG